MTMEFKKRTNGGNDITEEQYEKLDKIGIFDRINEKCDIFIDEYERGSSFIRKDIHGIGTSKSVYK